jgi:hypothetical protein
MMKPQKKVGASVRASSGPAKRQFAWRLVGVSH